MPRPKGIIVFKGIYMGDVLHANTLSKVTSQIIK